MLVGRRGLHDAPILEHLRRAVEAVLIGVVGVHSKADVGDVVLSAPVCGLQDILIRLSVRTEHERGVYCHTALARDPETFGLQFRLRALLVGGEHTLVERLNTEEDQLHVDARLEERLVGAARNRVLNFAGVRLDPRINEAELLRIDPIVVDVRLRIIAERVQRRLENVRVHLAATPQVWQRYEIEIADAGEWLLELDVEGDETLVNALRLQDVHAFVPLTSDTAVPGDEFRSIEVVVELPDGVTLVRAAPQVRFRLLAREGATP